MTFLKAWVFAGLALAAGCTPVLAADWGSVKDMGGVPVPVPAPAPVPVYDADSDWYVGLAIGGNILQDAKIRNTDIDYLGDMSDGVFARDSDDIGTSPIFSGSFGRYITPSLRWEIAVDYSPDSQISNSNRLGYLASNSAPKFSGGTISFDTNAYAITRTDTVKLARTTGLINLLYDIPTGTRFTPYIGGGVGFSWRSLRRTYSENAVCIGAANSDSGLYMPAGSCSGNPALSPGGQMSGSSSKQQIDFAAAVQAGIAYDINDSITWDNGWQMLWEGGAIASAAPSASGENRIVYKDSVLQQFRSGIRIKFN